MLDTLQVILPSSCSLPCACMASAFAVLQRKMQRAGQPVIVCISSGQRHQPSN
jgi:hypothetical protein